MKPRSFDAERLDVEAFATEGGSLRGEWPLVSMERLLESSHPDWAKANVSAVIWSARGELRKPRAGDPQVWLHLNVDTGLALVCQRCLGPVDTPMHIEKALRFVPSEETAAEMDADSDDDVLASTRNLDLHSLVEDELLLALPLVPRHDECPEDAPAYREPVGAEPSTTDKPNPFAVLSTLKRGAPDAK